MLRLAAAATLLVASPAASAEVEAPTQAFDMAVPLAPQPVTIGGRRLLRYELHLTSFAPVPLAVERLEVTGAAGESLLTLRGAALADVMRVIGVKEAGASIEPGRRAIVYLDLPLPPGAAAPQLRHRLSLRKQATAFLESGAEVTPRTGTPVRLGPPLRGGPWLAVYDPALDGGHRRVLFATAGRARVPGRFAIDWMPAPGGPGVGAEVIAVADATVAAAHDGVPEAVPGGPPLRLAAADEAGNYVILDVGGGRFVHYQHLAPGLAVRPGQRVRRGDPIGRVGGTGHVTKPHLHLHVADGPIPLASEGEAFTLDGGTVIGRYRTVFEAEAGGRWQAVPPRRLGRGDDDLPPPNAVVTF